MAPIAKQAMFVVLVIVALAGGTPLLAQMGPGLSLTVDDVNVSLHEPVASVLRIVNVSNEAASIDLGDDRIGNISVRTVFPDGHEERYRIPAHEGLARLGRVTVAAGKEYSQTLVLDMWATFNEVGEYRVAVSVLNAARANDDSSEIGPALGVVEVKKRDERKLINRCADLVASLSKADSYEEALADAVLLRYVQDPISVPFLTQAAESTSYPVQSLLIKGFESVGTGDAALALLDLMKRHPSFVPDGRVSLSHMRVSDPALRNRIDSYLESH